MILLPEPLTLEVEPCQALTFSPNGRYLMAQARETVRSFFTPEVINPLERNVIVFDLVEGTMTKLVLFTADSLSINIDDDCLRTYRLTRGDVVEMNIYKLPELVEMERFNLTFLPADYCCESCGVSFHENCNIVAMNCDDAIVLALSHGSVSYERANLLNKSGQYLKACEPLLMRIGNPSIPVDLQLTDSLVMERVEMEIPRVLDHEGHVIEQISHLFEVPRDATSDSLNSEGEQNGFNASTSHHPACDESFVEQSIRKPSKDEVELVKEEPVDSAGMEGKPSKQTAHGNEASQSTSQVMLLFDGSQETQTECNSDVLDTGTITLLLELTTEKYLVSQSSKKEYGEMLFKDFKNFVDASDNEYPVPDWDEFCDMMANSFDIRYLDKFCKDGESGDGYQITQILHTFKFNQHSHSLNETSAGEKANLEWSSAFDIGWIEQDVSWVFLRCFSEDASQYRFSYQFSREHGMWMKAMSEKFKHDKLLQKSLNISKEELESLGTETAGIGSNRLMNLIKDSSLPESLAFSKITETLQGFIQQSIEVQLDESVTGV